MGRKQTQLSLCFVFFACDVFILLIKLINKQPGLVVGQKRVSPTAKCCTGALASKSLEDAALAKLLINGANTDRSAAATRHHTSCWPSAAIYVTKKKLSQKTNGRADGQTDRRTGRQLAMANSLIATVVGQIGIECLSITFSYNCGYKFWPVRSE